MGRSRTQREDAATRNGVVRDHLATLRGTRGRLLWWQIIAQIAVPLVLGALAFKLGWRVAFIGDLITGFSVLAGFLFGLVIFVFQLRLGITHDPRIQQKASLPRLIDELFSNVLYAVGVSLLAVVATIAADATSVALRASAGGGKATEPWATAVLIVIGAHLLAVMGMCIKRTRTAYAALKE